MTCKKIIFIFLLSCYLFTPLIYAQTADTLKGKTDSVKKDFVTQMQAFAKREEKESLNDFNDDKAVIKQAKVLEEIKREIQKAKIYLKSGVDTAESRAELRIINENFEAARDGVFTNKGTAHTFRNLTATANIINELLSKTLVQKLRLEFDRDQLQNFHYRIDSLSSNKALFKFPQDSVHIKKYLKQIVVVAYEASPVDNLLKQSAENVQTLLNDVNIAAFKLQSELEEIERLKKGLGDHAFERDFDNIWSPAGYTRPFPQILTHSTEKAKLTLSFYLQNNKGKIVTLFLLIVIVYVYLRSLKNIYIENNLLTKGFEGQLVLRYPLFSCLVITINLFQFVFVSPPFILSVILWILSSLSLSLLFRNFITKYWMNVWLIIVALFIVATLDNLLLQASRIERWIMLFIMFAGVLTAVVTIWKGNRDSLRERWIIYPIGLMGLLELCGMLADIFGRYNLAKSFMISGYLNVVIAILFLWTVRMINEGLFLAYNVYTKQDKKLFYLNFQKVGDRAPAISYALLVLGWLVLFGRNFSFFEDTIRPFRDFFSEERTIGDYTFTINSLLLFISIMVVSVITSKIVSFFASDHSITTGKDERKGIQKIGSWLLLVRICILSIGLFLAVAAVGIPFDRITIVVGALGVGIGFGLQTLVNNLVSGLIIAFEKPVNVGDIVDIGGQSGTMKSIGFRSSIIATLDGADLVMPNGDLLSAHLTNWSLGGNRKRISILIGIAYDSDLQMIKKIVGDILDKEERVAKVPIYVVQYEQFNDSAISLRIYFWPRLIKEASATRSDLIIAIINAFRENNISIPFPQQDIHLHRMKDPEK